MKKESKKNKYFYKKITMKYTFYLIGLALFLCIGCSTDAPTPAPTPTPPVSTDPYFHMNVSGTDLSFPLPPLPSFNHVSIQKYGNRFSIGGNYAFSYDSNDLSQFNITFDTDAKIVYANQSSTSTEYGNYTYNNYQNYPDHYFDVQIISLDETNHRIKGSFSGKLYLNKLNINSESIVFTGDFDMFYDETGTSTPGISVGDVEQHCNMKLNGTVWTALYEYQYSSFTAQDAYKIEMHFANSNTPASFTVTPSSTDNYLRFSKFNTVTLVYDYYDLNGTVAYTYRENHGGGRYSYFGTFSGTAINPNNPSDVITITEGDFRSIQQF
jgi:hypothetical protein